jgi:hypothetical protein
VDEVRATSSIRQDQDPKSGLTNLPTTTTLLVRRHEKAYSELGVVAVDLMLDSRSRRRNSSE